MKKRTKKVNNVTIFEKKNCFLFFELNDQSKATIKKRK